MTERSASKRRFTPVHPGEVPLVAGRKFAQNDGSLSSGLPIVRTKLRPPRVRDGLLDRPLLVERLRSGRERALTLVCAPAGYGKTTVLAQWQAADRESLPFVWVALDEFEEDLVRQKYGARVIGMLDWPPQLEAGTVTKTHAWRLRDRDAYARGAVAHTDRLR